MQILNAIYPASYLFALLVSAFNRINRGESWSDDVLALNVLELEDGLVLTVECGFIKLCDTKIFFLAIRLWHLKESVDFSDSGNIVWDERLQLRFKVYFLRLVALNVFKELLDFVCYLKLSVVTWIVSSRHFFVIIIAIVIVVSASSCFLLHLHWLLSSH